MLAGTSSHLTDSPKVFRIYTRGVDACGFGAAVLAFIGGYVTNISMTDDGVLQRFYSAVL